MKTEMVLLIFNLVVNDNHSGNCVLHGACSSNVVEDQAILLLKEGAKELGSGVHKSLTLDLRTASSSSVAQTGKKDIKSLVFCRRKAGGNANGTSAGWLCVCPSCAFWIHTPSLYVRHFEGLWRG